MVQPITLSEIMDFIQSLIVVYEDYIYLGLVIFITINVMLGIRKIMVVQS